jgi:hypothetical protein
LAYPQKFADDPIPMKAIRLTGAFQRVFEALLAKPAIIDTLEDYDLEWKEDLEKINQRFKPEAAANAFFRAHLIYDGNLHAYVRDPETTEILQLDSRGWQPLSRGPHRPFKEKRSAYLPMTTGIDADYVIDPYDEHFPGPEGTFIRGAFRPVFLWRDEFERWFQKTFGTIKRRGRTRGSGSWANADEPLLEEMCELIENGSAKSPEDAAKKVADRAAGGGSWESKFTRLAKRYRKQFPPERN